MHPLGDAAALVELGSRIDTALNTRAIGLAAALRKRRGVREAIPGYASVTIHYDPEQVSFTQLQTTLRNLLKERHRPPAPGRLHRIPVIYDGPDLEETARRVKLSVPELIKLHTAPTYRVFMVGFVPGWAYLGPLPEPLRLPRRSVPRTHVPAGSVAIAGAQTGVYPLPTPGGWHLLGHTDLPMFLPESDPPLLLRTGDRVKFYATD
ncbi:MAG TPA: 5-oxoprolinase subunit PxpB [Candidatus Dormibacteraeota bacterium]